MSFSINADFAKYLKVLANKIRIEILNILSRYEALTASQILKHLEEIGYSVTLQNVLKHLNILLNYGLIIKRSEGFSGGEYFIDRARHKNIMPLIDELSKNMMVAEMKRRIREQLNLFQEDIFKGTSESENVRDMKKEILNNLEILFVFKDLLTPEEIKFLNFVKATILSSSEEKTAKKEYKQIKIEPISVTFSVTCPKLSEKLRIGDKFAINFLIQNDSNIPIKIERIKNVVPACLNIEKVSKTNYELTGHKELKLDIQLAPGEIENIEIVVKVIDDGTYTYTPILVVSVNGHKKCFTGELITIQAIRN